jgi:hypothetical protein
MAVSNCRIGISSNACMVISKRSHLQKKTKNRQTGRLIKDVLACAVVDISKATFDDEASEICIYSILQRKIGFSQQKCELANVY